MITADVNTLGLALPNVSDWLGNSTGFRLAPETKPKSHTNELNELFVGHRIDSKSEILKTVKCAHDELVERYIGEGIPESELFNEPTIKRVLLDYRSFSRDFLSVEKKSSSSNRFFTKDKVRILAQSMLSILILRSTGNLQAGRVYESPVFRKMAKEIGLVFDPEGNFVDATDRFKMFLRRHDIQ